MSHVNFENIETSLDRPGRGLCTGGLQLFDFHLIEGFGIGVDSLDLRNNNLV